MKTILFIICCIPFMLSCKKNDKEKEQKSNQQELFTKKIAQYEKNGKPIILKSSKNQLIVYKDSTSFWLDNLKEPAKKILSAEDTTSIYHYTIKWDKYDKPDIEKKHFRDALLDKNFWTDTDKKNGDDYTYPYTESNITLKEDLGVIFFTYKENYLDEYEEQKEHICTYLLYLSKPNELILLDYKDRIDNYKGYFTAVSDPMSLAANYDLYDGLFESFYYKTCGSFYWGFEVDSVGNDVSHQGFINYENGYYNKSMRFELNEFSSKEKVINVLQAIKDTIQRAEEKEYINGINEKAINIDDISNCFKNEVKAEKEFLNKELIVRCSIDAIEKADGWLDTDGYKYKIRAYSTELFDEWISGYDIVGYTNDEGFANLSCPNDIIMKCVLTSGSCRRFTFKDCELMLFGK